jgi:CubicO group peptidase (beta-lactamase class C family)
VFEIGSVTKVFTSLVLAEMVKEGEVKLEDPVSKYLPAGVKVPGRKGKEITLVDLATHTSGLPRLPGNLAPADGENPYAGYTVERMYAFLSGYTLPRDIGVQYEYSNFGAGLLGHVLGLKAGMGYEALVMRRICVPLEMKDTRITLSSDMTARMAPGHDEAGKVVENWDCPALAGCGALRSTANDLMTFVSASMGVMKSDLRPAMEFQQIARREADSADLHVGLGWHILGEKGKEIVWHNGGTGGYRSFIGFNKKEKRGVVVLVNSANDIDDVGMPLLASAPGPAREHVAIAVDPKTYDAYVGKYRLAPGVELTVQREKEKLMVQMTGQPFFEVFPESETGFFYKVVDAQLTFKKNARGEAMDLVLHQGGFDHTAVRER